MQNPYNYGKSIISSNLRYSFKNGNPKTGVKLKKFCVEIKVYCGRKSVYNYSNIFTNVTINYAIRRIFHNQIEQKVTFHRGYNYYATFKVYELVPVLRKKYIKTDTTIESNRRKYLLQERINIYI